MTSALTVAPQLRIATAGSVDDGKSTLIGRLLHDSKAVFEDQLHAVARASRRYGDGELNLALLTDGLRAEREQGITIDVAYRYFATPRRGFVVADTPGHAQYTRNMVTGASVSDVAIVLVDARKGAVDQTTRHVAVAALLGVEAIVLAVNKMDLVGWDEGVFDRVAKEVRSLVDAISADVPVIAIPVSALLGDNVVERSTNAPWYAGPAMLELLEDFHPAARRQPGARLAVQWVIRPRRDGHHDSRSYAGRLAGGPLEVGADVVVLPSARRTRVVGIDRSGEPIERAETGHAVALRLADELDVGRGAVIVDAGAARHPVVATEVVADVCWMSERPLDPGSRWVAKHLTSTVRATVDSIEHRLALDSLRWEAATQLSLNDLGRVHLRLVDPIVADPYTVQHEGGRMVLIDEATNDTAAAVMIREAR
jgi:sulfate adenylyltransferase large subunit